MAPGILPGVLLEMSKAQMTSVVGQKGKKKNDDCCHVGDYAVDGADA